MYKPNERAMELGRLIRQKRVMLPMTLHKLAALSGVSPSHLGRIEKGGRFPSAGVLRRIARPLGFEEDELFYMAGYMSHRPDELNESLANYGSRLDPYVYRLLAREPIEVQRVIPGLLTLLKSIARNNLTPSDY